MQKIYSVDINKESDFYGLSQQNKQLKTIDKNEAWPDIFDQGHAHQSHPVPTHKISRKNIPFWIKSKANGNWDKNMITIS